MSSVTQKYLQQAQAGASRQFNNFTGSGAYFTGNGGYNGQDGSMSGGAQAPAAQAQPYIITISNSTASQVNNFVIFNAWNYLYGQGGTFTNGSLVPTNTGVTISGALSNVTYQYLLSQTNTIPFAVGATQIITTVNAAQVNQSMQVQSIDANGDAVSKQIIWAINPFQNQNGTIINNTQYRIDGSTSLTFSVLPNAVFTLYFWPMQSVDQARSLTNSAPSQQFGNPGLQPANTVVIPAASAGGATTIVNRLRS